MLTVGTSFFVSAFSPEANWGLDCLTQLQIISQSFSAKTVTSNWATHSFAAKPILLLNWQFSISRARLSTHARWSVANRPVIPS